jgi:hypothetical protein
VAADLLADHCCVVHALPVDAEDHDDDHNDGGDYDAGAK